MNREQRRQAERNRRNAKGSTPSVDPIAVEAVRDRLLAGVNDIGDEQAVANHQALGEQLGTQFATVIGNAVEAFLWQRIAPVTTAAVQMDGSVEASDLLWRYSADMLDAGAEQLTEMARAIRVGLTDDIENI